jgi:ketosteroid isomerase-like protein
MKKVSLIALAMLAIYLAAPSLTLGQGGTVEQQIKTLSDQLAQAYVKDDTSFLEKYLADDYVGIFASSQPVTKAESLKPGAVKYESFDVHEMKIRVYGDTAVVTSLTSSKGELRADGKPFSGDFRTTRVWVKQKDGWKLVTFQSTQVPPASK